MDGYSGISRGLEQWTVTSPDTTSVGPIHYEIVEPMKKIRIRLEEKDSQTSLLMSS